MGEFWRKITWNTGQFCENAIIVEFWVNICWLVAGWDSASEFAQTLCYIATKCLKWISEFLFKNWFDKNWLVFQFFLFELKFTLIRVLFPLIESPMIPILIGSFSNEFNFLVNIGFTPPTPFSSISAATFLINFFSILMSLSVKYKSPIFGLSSSGSEASYSYNSDSELSIGA